MSHDRGCWQCGDDIPPYDDCQRKDCPKRKCDVRQSTMSWLDCKYLHRKLSETQEKIMEFACNGFKKTGFSDDQKVIISLLELKKEVDKIIEKNREVNG